jgi:hypothetical protein
MLARFTKKTIFSFYVWYLPQYNLLAYPVCRKNVYSMGPTIRRSSSLLRITEHVNEPALNIPLEFRP